MSQNIYDPELVAIFQDQYVETIILNALSTLVAYEYFITFGQEIASMWRRGLNGATILFFLNRYLMVLSVILVYVPFTAKVCSGIMRFTETVLLAQFIVFAVFSALRVYALWDRNVPLALVIFVLNLVPFGTNLYDFGSFPVEYYLDPIFGQFCNLAVPSSKLYTIWLPIATRTSLVVADALVIVLTWIKTYDAYKTASSLNISTPLLSLFFRDGTIYFIAVLLMNIMHILLQSVSAMRNLSPATLFFSTLTPILISRFLLNLRQLDQPNVQYSEDDVFSQFSHPGFHIPQSLVIGNLGASLEHVDDALDLNGTVSSGELGDSSTDPVDINTSTLTPLPTHN